MGDTEQEPHQGNPLMRAHREIGKLLAFGKDGIQARQGSGGPKRSPPVSTDQRQHSYFLLCGCFFDNQPKVVRIEKPGPFL